MRIHTKEKRVEYELMSSAVVQLENGHMPYCAADVHDQQYRGDGNVDAFRWYASKCPRGRQVRRSLSHLVYVRLSRGAHIRKDSIPLTRS